MKSKDQGYRYERERRTTRRMLKIAREQRSRSSMSVETWFWRVDGRLYAAVVTNAKLATPVVY